MGWAGIKSYWDSISLESPSESKTCKEINKCSLHSEDTFALGIIAALSNFHGWPESSIIPEAVSCVGKEGRKTSYRTVSHEWGVWVSNWMCDSPQISYALWAFDTLANIQAHAKPLWKYMANFIVSGLPNLITMMTILQEGLLRTYVLS